MQTDATDQLHTAATEAAYLLRSLRAVEWDGDEQQGDGVSQHWASPVPEVGVRAGADDFKMSGSVRASNGACNLLGGGVSGPNQGHDGFAVVARRK